MKQKPKNKKASPKKTSTMKAKPKKTTPAPKSVAVHKKTAKKAETHAHAHHAAPATTKAASATKATAAAKKQPRARAPRETRPTAATCRVIGCTLPATTNGYSRTCYIKYWKQIKQKEQILEQGALQKYIRELVDKYPEKMIMSIHADLGTDSGYADMIRDLDLYGGIDELEHAHAQSNDDEEAAENDLDDIKKGMDKEDDLF